MNTLENKADHAILPGQEPIGTTHAYTDASVETPQQKDKKPMAWYSKATVSGSTLPQQPGAMRAESTAPVNQPAYESSANPIIARAFALGADLTEAY